VELSPRQRRAVFAVIVIVLAALGYYLVVPAVTHSRGHTQAVASPTPAGPAAATTPTPGPTETAPAAAGAVNIYAWLPTGPGPTTLQAGYSTPGVVSTRTSQQQVSTGTAAINSLRAFGPSSLTFVVSTTQHLVSSHGASSGSAQYAVTLTGSGSSWQVSDIELASAGNS
jgi:hypothetical protein